MCNLFKLLSSIQSLKSTKIDAFKETHFYIKTRKNETEKHRITIENFATKLPTSGFDSSKATKVIIHGYLNGADSTVNQVLTKSFLENFDVNVIIVSWGKVAKTWSYEWAALNTKEIGKVVAVFLDTLFEDDLAQWENLTVVGHSLGAHVAGFTGKQVTKGRIGTIVALDPG